MKDCRRFPYLVIAVAFCLVVSCHDTTQGHTTDGKVRYKYADHNGQIRLSDEVTIPEIPSGYTAWIPKGELVGTIVFFHGRSDTLNPDSIVELAWARKMSVVYVTTEHRLDFLLDSSAIVKLAGIVEDAIYEHQLPRKKVLFCGMSLAGTRAMKMANYFWSQPSGSVIRPAAIAICDAPLDLRRFYYSMKKAVEDNTVAVTAAEGEWITSYLIDQLGGDPEDNLPNYKKHSVLLRKDGKVDMEKHLYHLPILAYTEPDVQWWIEERGKDYYDMNAIDLGVLINELKRRGNEEARLVTTSGKGYFPDGQRHPHSWSIVDEEAMLEWFEAIIANLD